MRREATRAADLRAAQKPARDVERGMGAQYRLGNRERRETAIGIEQTPISFGQKIPLRHFYLVTLRHNESLSRGPQIAETQPWTFGKHSRPRYARFERRIVPRGSLEYFGIIPTRVGSTSPRPPIRPGSRTRSRFP